MSVAAADLLAPTGDLVPSLFPGEDASALTARLDAYIAEGMAQTTGIGDSDARDDAVTHYAYGRAYRAIFVRLSGDPTGSSLMSSMLSVTYSAQQIQNFLSLAKEHEAAFTAAIPLSATTARTPHASAATGNVFLW